MRECVLKLFANKVFPSTHIAQEISKNVSNISREISRNKDPGREAYHYSFAHKMAHSRREKANSLRVKIKHTKVKHFNILLFICRITWREEQVKIQMDC